MENWFKIEFLFAKNLNILPSELDQMEFYRIEYMIQNYEEFIEEEKKEYEKQQKEQSKSFKQSSTQSKLPNQNIKMPRVQMPNISTPKF